MRQSIIRVSPDAHLSSIFTTICDKLNLDADARKLIEFRHPTDHDVHLDLNSTLNHYNLRELYLADKREGNRVFYVSIDPNFKHSWFAKVHVVFVVSSAKNTFCRLRPARLCI